MSEQSAVPTVFDLNNNTVTRDQYRAAITSLIGFMIQLGYDKGWCSERHDYFSAITPEYNQYDVHEPNFANTPDGSEGVDGADTDPGFDTAGGYGKLLANVRSRILWYVRAEQIDLENANRAFNGMNVPVYPNPKPTDGTRHLVYLPSVEVNVSSPELNYDRETHDWIASNLPAIITAAVNGVPFDGPNYVVPGSMAFTSANTEVYRASPTVTVAETDTLRPSHT